MPAQASSCERSVWRPAAAAWLLEPAVGDNEFPSRHQSPPSSALARWDAGRTKKTAMGGMTVQPNEITEVLNRPISQELLARDLTRLAYVAKDGTPRNVPIAFTWRYRQVNEGGGRLTAA